MRNTRNDRKYTLLLCLSLMGLTLAGLAGASEHVPWLQAWCAVFSNGCRQAAQYTLWRMPLWYFGVGFYSVLTLAVLFVRPVVAWLIPAAVGVEITLMAIMLQTGALCVYCLGNAGVVALLAILFFDWENFWRAMALMLLGLLASTALIGRENHVVPAWLCPLPPLAANGPARPPLPTPPITAEITPGDSQTLGPDDAPLTVYEYTDFRCPACRRQHAVMNEAMKLHPGKIRWVFKNFPLSMHPDAEIAAEGALCAAGQNKFWEYQDALFTFQEAFTPESLEAVAGTLGLDTAAFRQCLAARATQHQVDREVQEGVNAGIDGVPCLVVNGVIHPGTMPLKDVQAILDQALKER